MQISPEGICSCWSEHVIDLFTPKENPKFDTQYKNEVNNNLIHREEICRCLPQLIVPVTEEEMRKAMKNQTNIKSADPLASKDFIHCTDEIVQW